MHPRGKGGRKVYIFRLGHMTKITAMRIYGKNPKNLLQNHWNLVSIICGGGGGGGSSDKVCINDDPGLTLTYFMARSNLVP